MQTVKSFINEIIDSFNGSIAIPYEQLLKEYNSVVRELSLMVPAADGSMTLASNNKKLNTSLLPPQIRRVFFGENELFSASRSLMDILPDAMLYHAEKDVIYVNRDGEYTVHFRTLPQNADADDASACVCDDGLLKMLLRSYLLRAVFLFVGDTVSADCYTKEYNSLLEDYKKQNGVRE